MTPFSTKAWAKWCLDRGWVVIPVTYQGKDPCLKNWQLETLETARANLDQNFPEGVQRNLGNKLGEDSGGLTDIDLDCDETVKLAPDFLPPTLTFGRPSKVKSHWLYTSEDLVSEQFKDPLKSSDNKSAVLVEIRANAKSKNGAQQTVFPPSTHTSGELIAFTDPNKPTTKIEADALHRHVSLLATAALLGRHWVGEGARHMAALACAGMLKQYGCTVEEVVKIVRAIATVTNDEEIEDREKAARSTLDKIDNGDQNITGAPTLEEYGIPKQVLKRVKQWLAADSQVDPTAAPLFQIVTNLHPATDASNAQRFAQLYQGKLLYVIEKDKWIAWSGACWREDKIAPLQGALEIAKRIVEEARAADVAGNPDLAKLLRAHAKATQSLKARLDMIKDARSIPGMFVSMKDLDKDSYLVACPNGTMDLRTGIFREARPEDLLTHLCPTVYDPEAKAPLWEKTILEIMNGDPELASYLQLYAGYTATGCVLREVMFLLWGTGSNGKSVLLRTMQHVLGEEHSCTVPTNVLLNNVGSHSDHPTGLTIMHGKRLADSYETEMNKQLAEGLIKSITGGDKIAARKMREDFWEYLPRHTIWLATNHKPVIRGTDHGIWRRIIPIEFSRIFKLGEGGDANANLSDLLKLEASGILNWIFTGARAFLEKPELFDTLPEKMQHGRDNYQAEQDRLGTFLEDCIEYVEGEKTTTKAVWARYLSYCRETGDDQISQTAFFRMLDERGFPLKRSNGQRYRMNLKLRSTLIDGVKRNLVGIEGGKAKESGA